MKLALIVIDMQNYFKDLAEPILKNITALVEQCHKKAVPVIFTQHHDPDPRSVQSVFLQTQIIHGSESWQLYGPVMDLANKEKDFFIKEKCRYDAFWNTRLKDVLLKECVDTVIITGVMTNLCCETTARTAVCNDFNILFVSDGNATRQQEWHNATLDNIGGFFGKVVTTEEVLKLI